MQITLCASGGDCMRRFVSACALGVSMFFCSSVSAGGCCEKPCDPCEKCPNMWNECAPRCVEPCDPCEKSCPNKWDSCAPVCEEPCDPCEQPCPNKWDERCAPKCDEDPPQPMKSPSKKMGSPR